MNAAGLHRLLTEYVAYYMRSRTHLALGKDTPITRPVAPPSAGPIVAIPEIGRSALPLRPRCRVAVASGDPGTPTRTIRPFNASPVAVNDCRCS